MERLIQTKIQKGRLNEKDTGFKDTAFMLLRMMMRKLIMSQRYIIIGVEQEWLHTKRPGANEQTTFWPSDKTLNYPNKDVYLSDFLTKPQLLTNCQ